MEEREEYWRKKVSQWKASGLSLRDFAEREGIGMSSLGAWRRKLAQLDEARGVGLARVEGTGVRRPSIDLVVGAGVVVRVDEQTDLRLLRTVVAALREPVE
jgi:hypothetical protein